ncbi:MAG TPA: hypothetical protein VIW29_16270 [Polyangiaceae bacterium]
MHKEPNSEEQPIAPERGGDGSAVGGAPGAGSPAGFREPLGENALEQLRHYQVMTIPPDARAAFLSAQLPGASPELLYDTLPPNAGAEHASGALELPNAEPELEAEPGDATNQGDVAEQDVELAAAEAAGAPDRHLRGIAIAGGILLVVALLLGWATLSGDREIQRALGRQSAPPEHAARQQAALPSPQFPAAPTSRLEASPAAAGARAAPSAPARTAAAAPPSFSEQKPATHAPEAPNSRASVASPAAPSEPAAAPNQPPAASSAAAPAKKFRLGSR